MKISLNPSSVADYGTFLKVKMLPQYRFTGRDAWFPDEYADRLHFAAVQQSADDIYIPNGAFDYQRDLSRLAIQKQKYAVFADCGLGKTLILLSFVNHVSRVVGASRPLLVISPLMVIPQTIAEAGRWFHDMQIAKIPASELAEWTRTGSGIGITNYDALTDDVTQGNIAMLALDESSMLKSHYGKWGQKCLELGKGLEWKLCMTGTPAPNDRIEYANHAVFLDHFPTVNSFLARFFVNRGQTDNRWELKPHALHPFYKALSHWCMFLTNPATYGWSDNAGKIPPIHIHIDHVEMTPEQNAIARSISGRLMPTEIGGIGSRSVMGQLAKGRHRGLDVPTNKFNFIREMIASWPEESTIIWCHFNDEQERCAELFPDAANIDGQTTQADRQKLVDEFKSGVRKVLISKPRILGFGLNLQIATRQVFSGLQDSYEEFYQAVKRSNRVGSTRPLNVHIPVTEIERPMIETVLRKAAMIQRDTEEQELIFKTHAIGLEVQNG